MRKLNDFDEKRAYGHAAEKEIQDFFEADGYTVFRIVKRVEDIGIEGPELERHGKFKAPDLLVYRPTNARFIEVKHTPCCIYFRDRNTMPDDCWNLSLKKETFDELCKKNESSKLKITIVWSVDGGIDKNGYESLSGKFVQDLEVLEKSEKYYNQKSGMIFWKLKYLDNLYTFDLPRVKYRKFNK